MFPFIWNFCPFQPATYFYYAIFINKSVQFLWSSILLSPHCWVGVEYSSLKDSFWINAFKISFNFSSFALHLVINLQWLMLSHELVSSTMNSLEANTDRFFQLCKKKHFLFISSLVSGNYSIILFSFSLVCVTPKKFLPLIPWFLLILLIF